MRGTSVIALRALVVVATVVSCTGVLPTQLACDETTLCPTGYCCGSSGFCAPDGDPICLAPTDAGLPDAGVEPPDAGLVDAGVDAGEDAGPSTDAGTDAGPAPMDAGSGADAGADAGSDAGSDAGPGTDAGSGADGGADAGVDGGPGAPDGGSDAGAAVVAPSDLTYSTNPAVYTRGQAIPDDAPSSQGGAVTLYEISAALPQGLTFDPATGVVSGTPTSVVPTTSYVVTASNSGGSTQVTLTITVNDIPPSDLTYSTNPAIFTRGQPITNDSPSNSGGTVTLWAISPALPEGLSMDSMTGVVSGTPEVPAPETGYTVTATNSGGSAQVTLTITVNDVAPSGLTYATNPAVYTKGVAIPDDTPSNGGGSIVSYGVSPALPAGLSLSTTTGIISGTPTVLSAQTVYVVTGTNSGGSVQAELAITVNDKPPSGLHYATNPAVFTRNQTVAEDVPSTTGGGAVISWAISPALPAGLSFSTATGIVSGTPTVLSSATGYTVTATNTGGSAQVTLTLTVNDEAPTGLSYATNPAVFTKGMTITSDDPSTSGGGAVVSWAISPALPSGLSFDTGTGIVSGTPTVVSAATAYLVTATNTGGSAQVTLTITVNDVAPSGLTYATSPLICTEGVAITNDVPSSGGGTVVSYSITPGLPAGLTFSTSTGIISGTPTVVSPAASYTVTATSSGGSAQVVLSITVNPPAPSGLAYTTNPASFTEGVTITNDVPTTTGGGPVASYSITPSLPAGLAFNTSTGVISGTPTAVSATTAYTVTATNAGGSTQVTLTITVSAAAPTGLTYSTDPAVYTVGQTIVSNVPSNGGGAATSYSISTPLPSGLSFSTTTGVISGTPTAASPQTNYTITATNSAGSTTFTLTITVNAGTSVSGNTSGQTGAVTAGYQTGCTIVNGGARCWGLNSNGQVGNNTTTDSWVPAQVWGLTSGVQAVAANSFEVCAIVNGGAMCWGKNDQGQLGNGTTTQSTIPVQVSGLTSGVQALACAGEHACALVNGGVQCWGQNPDGQLGNNSTVNSAVPVQVVGLTSGVQAIAAAYNHSCALVNGGVQCWGDNSSGDLGNGTATQSDVPVQVTGLTSGVQAIAAGDHHSCALINGEVQCWGSNSNGQLGSNTGIDSSDVPVQVSGLTSGVQAISAGTAFSCAVVNGGVECWGYNADGELGDASTEQSAVPVTVSVGGGVQAISSGSYHTCALVNGGVQCWGYGSNGSLGDNSTSNEGTPVQVTGITSGLQAIAGGQDHTCALVNGGVQCWGSNSGGQLGNNSAIDSEVPVQVSNLTSGVQAIVTGDVHTCALVNGGVRCWGGGSSGQLGNNSTANSPVPVQVTGLTSGVQAITANSSHTCALINGGVECWGDNGWGDLGNNSMTQSNVPVPVSGLSLNVQGIAAGGLHTCAIVNGGVECWGDNGDGQLGNNSNVNSYVPVRVMNLTGGAQALAGGWTHTCAIVNGAAQCWGEDTYGELGDNLFTNSPVPLQVDGFSTGVQVIAAAEGGYDTCVVRNGAVECWGQNTDGQLGNNATTNVCVPVPVSNLASGAQAVTAGNTHTCAIVSGGVECWGNNGSGQLGDGSASGSGTPVSVSAWAP